MDRAREFQRGTKRQLPRHRRSSQTPRPCAGRRKGRQGPRVKRDQLGETAAGGLLIPTL
jgi:hypothetical protein